MLTSIEVELIAIGVDAFLKLLENNKKDGTQQATQFDVNAARARLDKAKAELDAAVESQPME